MDFNSNFSPCRNIKVKACPSVQTSFAIQYNHKQVFDNLDDYDYVDMKMLGPEWFDSRIVIGLQSTAYAGPLDPKWEIIIGGGVGGRRRFKHFVHFAENGFVKNGFTVVKMSSSRYFYRKLIERCH